MSDTFFTGSPHWGWYITFYFFIGGIAGGAFFISCLLYLFGRPEDRSVVRLGYYVAFAGAVLSGILLTLDLTRPLRFWHMLFQPDSLTPMLKTWSPMSVGAWGLVVFSVFAFLATVGALVEENRLGWKQLDVLNRGLPGAVIAVVGSFFGLFLAGYTGVLLAVTNRPIWADSTLLGMVFLASAASTGAASLILLCRWRGDGSAPSAHWLSRFDRRALLFELISLVAFVVSLGSVARVFIGWWGVVLLVGVLGFGILLPLRLDARSAGREENLMKTATLVLVGGFLLRVVIIFSSSQIHVVGAGLSIP